MNAAYGASINVSDRTIDSHIRNIRAKLAQRGAATTSSKPCMASASSLGRCTVRP